MLGNLGRLGKLDGLEKGKNTIRSGGLRWVEGHSPF